MFRLTLINFDPEARRASSAIGEVSLGERTGRELAALLAELRGVDAIENVEAEPAVLIETRRQKHVVTTNVGRLYLTEPRNAGQPALVLSPDEIVAELDGSAAAARQRAVSLRAAQAVEPRPASARPESPASPPPTPLLRRFVWTGLATGFAVYALWGQMGLQREFPVPEFEFISDRAQADAYRADLVAVYTTGDRPGERGIALGDDGTLKLFQVNAKGAPSLLTGTYRMGRVDGRISALGSHDSAPLQFDGRNTLSYRGETYRRIR